MATFAEIVKMIDALSPEDYSKFRKWMADRSYAEWDEQIEADSKAGKFDAVIARVREEHAEGKTRPL